VLGILYPSAIFEGRAPEGGALLSVFLGGIKREDIYNLSDDELKATALKEVQHTMGVNSQPDMVKLFRYPHAIAQYERSSEERFEQIKLLEDRIPGLILAGNIRNGIGMSDRVVQGVSIAKLICQ
jgi:Protoporphyrinogen oxidase